MTKLTQAQTDLLRQAAEDPTGTVDAPDDAKLIKPLIKQGFVISLPRAGGGSRLMITDAGRAAVAEKDPGGAQAGSDTVDASPPADAGNAGDESANSAPPGTVKQHRTPKAAEGPSGKLGTLVALLKRPNGATVTQMTVATGWQAHSVRGAMSGAIKKKLGLIIDSEKTDAGRVYRIRQEDAA